MHRRLAEQLFQTLRSGGPEPFRALLDESSVWELHGRSKLAGLHRGPDAILMLLTCLTELHPIREDAYDVMVSAHHAVLTTRLIAEGLDSDHAIVVVARADGRLARAFHYIFDLYAFDAYFQ